MKPITVSVGPLAAAVANSVVNAHTTPGPGQLLLSGPILPGGTTTGVNITGSITNGVLTVTTVTGGVVGAGMALNGDGLPLNCKIIGPAPGNVGNVGNGSTWIVSPTVAAFASGSIRGNYLLTFDQPRQLAVTTTQAAPGTLTIYGFDAAGSPMQETLAYNGGNLTTVQPFKAVTQVASSVAAGPITIGTAATSTSPWVAFDPWAAGNVSIQANVQGVANYTIQISNDDPNDPETPVPPGQMTWMPDPNATDVGATTNEFNTWQFVPLWARVLLNSGAGMVTATFVQTANVNR